MVKQAGFRALCVLLSSRLDPTASAGSEGGL